MNTLNYLAIVAAIYLAAFGFPHVAYAGGGNDSAVCGRDVSCQTPTALEQIQQTMDQLPPAVNWGILALLAVFIIFMAVMLLRISRDGQPTRR